MRFPSIKNVAEELRDISANVEGECEVRLQVYEDGKWCVRAGDPSYDLDHHGYWGASWVPGVVGGKVVRFNSYDVARELLDQVKDDFYTGSSLFGVRDVVERDSSAEYWLRRWRP